MGEVKLRQETARKLAQSEDTIRKALNAVQTMNKDGKPEMSLREASKAFSILFSTFQGWWKGAQPYFIAYQNQLVLSVTDEKAVLWWIQNLENCGFPPKLEHVHQAAELIVKTEVGANWITRFLDRHPQLVAKFTTPMEFVRMEAASHSIIRDHFA